MNITPENMILYIRNMFNKKGDFCHTRKYIEEEYLLLHIVC